MAQDWNSHYSGMPMPLNCQWPRLVYLPTLAWMKSWIAGVASLMRILLLKWLYLWKVWIIEECLVSHATQKGVWTVFNMIKIMLSYENESPYIVKDTQQTDSNLAFNRIINGQHCTFLLSFWNFFLSSFAFIYMWARMDWSSNRLVAITNALIPWACTLFWGLVSKISTNQP